jgi:hypothetical protein
MIELKATQTIPSDVFVSPYLSMRMKEGILFCRYANDLHLSIEVAKACVEARIYFTKGKSSFLIIDMKGIKSTTKEARRYLATVGATLVTAAALITGSPLNNALANLFLMVDKPPVPTKLFTSEAKATEWIKKIMLAHSLEKKALLAAAERAL